MTEFVVSLFSMRKGSKQTPQSGVIVLLKRGVLKMDPERQSTCTTFAFIGRTSRHFSSLDTDPLMSTYTSSVPTLPDDFEPHLVQCKYVRSRIPGLYTYYEHVDQALQTPSCLPAAA